MQNTTFLVRLRAIFAQKKSEYSPPFGIGDEVWSTLTLEIKVISSAKTASQPGSRPFILRLHVMLGGKTDLI